MRDFRAFPSGFEKLVQVVGEKTGRPCPRDPPAQTESRPQCRRPVSAGGEKLKAVPAGKFLSSWFKRALMA